MTQLNKYSFYFINTCIFQILGIHEWDDESDEEIAHEKFGELVDEEKNVTQKRYFGM